MKKLLLVLLVLALAGVACSTAPPQIVYVEVTPVPKIVPPTVAPTILPTPKPAGPDIPSATRAYLLGEGFTGPSIDNKGENGCTMTYCIHYNRTRGGMAFSHYFTGTKLVGIVTSHTIGEEDGPFGEFSAKTFITSGIPEDAIRAIGDLLGINGGGKRDLPSGWRAVVNIDGGRLFLIAVLPGATGASYSGQGS